ncbi:MAG TPA: Fur family transcriptional regulator [Verrucomicrobiota bacterium]|nr:Fur family transcriptional regulator [Verrucomicrobiota bacterium]
MERLRNQAGRVTQPRQVILDALVRLQRPSTPREIVEALSRDACDPATVYRSLSLFQRMGLVRRVDLGDGVARFEIADDDPRGHHHHHLWCRRCKRIVRLDQCVLAEVEAALARHYGYADVQHRLEFFGICPECQRAQPTPRPPRRPGVTRPPPS